MSSLVKAFVCYLFRESYPLTCSRRNKMPQTKHLSEIKKSTTKSANPSLYLLSHRTVAVSPGLHLESTTAGGAIYLLCTYLIVAGLPFNTCLPPVVYMPDVSTKPLDLLPSPCPSLKKSQPKSKRWKTGCINDFTQLLIAVLRGERKT